MTETKSDRQVTDYLRGLAIAVVLVSHYSSTYDEDFYTHYLNNYGNAFMAIFFILAGYGAYYSFEKRFAGKSTNLRVISRYLIDRALRIYPLYWLALLMVALVEPQNFPVGDLGIVQVLAVATGFPFITTPLWFIPSILQCYIFAPFLYLIFKKIGLRRFAYFNLAMLVMIMITSQEYVHLLSRFERMTSITIPDPTGVLFRGVFLGNVFLFSVGIMTPMLVRIFGERMKSMTIFFVSAFLLFACSYILRYDILVFKHDQLLMEVVYYASVFFFILSAVIVNPVLPLMGFVTLMGRYSYSLYLFHILLFHSLMVINLFQEPLPLSMMIVLLSFPILLWMCIVSEKSSRAFRNRLWSIAGRKIKSAPEVSRSSPG
jgi:peptidoglycan/LPS O-acetylase OafA/YrhL